MVATVAATVTVTEADTEVDTADTDGGDWWDEDDFLRVIFRMLNVRPRMYK